MKKAESTKEKTQESEPQKNPAASEDSQKESFLAQQIMDLILSERGAIGGWLQECRVTYRSGESACLTIVFPENHRFFFERLTSSKDAPIFIQRMASRILGYYVRVLISIDGTPKDGKDEVFIVEQGEGAISIARQKSQDEPFLKRSRPYVRFYKDGDSMSIETNCQDEDGFFRLVAESLSSMIDAGKHENDWEFQFLYWLPQIHDIACKLKGYKNGVMEERVLLAGSIWPEEKDLNFDSRSHLTA